MKAVVWLLLLINAVMICLLARVEVRFRYIEALNKCVLERDAEIQHRMDIIEHELIMTGIYDKVEGCGYAE